jgi:tetratricopeptide (TPR) repeat protein
MAKNTKDAGSELKLVNTDLAKGIFPSKSLLEARVLFDGGYYERAQEILVSLRSDKLPSKYQCIELEYRIARVLQEQKRYTDALSHFKKCLDLGMGVNTYLLPNSCLQIGLIYEHLNYPSIAKTYYEKVSSYHHVDYESSMGQKAKTNIWRIKKSE